MIDPAVEKDLPLTEAVFYILLAVRQPNHGYGIIGEVEELTAHRVVLGAGTLYGALNTLLEKGWITALPGERNSRKKEYVITETGLDALHQELTRLEELVTNGKALLKEGTL